MESELFWKTLTVAGHQLAATLKEITDTAGEVTAIERRGTKWMIVARTQEKPNRSRTIGFQAPEQ